MKEYFGDIQCDILCLLQKKQNSTFPLGPPESIYHAFLVEIPMG